MGEIVHARVDDRLIHGQVVAKWVKGLHPNVILVIENVLATDKFMQDIYKMAAPPGIEVKVVNVKTASEEWQKNGFGQDKVFILFKDILTVKEAIEAGIPIKKLNIGGIRGKPGGSNKLVIQGSMRLEESDVNMLLDLQERGNVEISFQMIPEFERLEFSSILKKYFPTLQRNLKKEE